MATASDDARFKHEVIDKLPILDRHSICVAEPAIRSTMDVAAKKLRGALSEVHGYIRVGADDESDARPISHFVNSADIGTRSPKRRDMRNHGITTGNEIVVEGSDAQCRVP